MYISVHGVYPLFDEIEDVLLSDVLVTYSGRRSQKVEGVAEKRGG